VKTASAAALVVVANAGFLLASAFWVAAAGPTKVTSLASVESSTDAGGGASRPDRQFRLPPPL
jgi:hypothetical protein